MYDYHKTVSYIDVRIKDLLEEAQKCHDDHDKAWFKRAAQELQWTREMFTREHKRCVLETCVQQDLF